MRKRVQRLISMLLSLALLIGLGATTTKAEAEPAPTAPAVSIEVRAVTQPKEAPEEGEELTGELEVSLALTKDAAAGEDIRSLSGILRYDTTRLTMKAWDDSEIALSATPKSASTMASGEVAGKYSMAYKPAEGDWAYVRFSAQASDSLNVGTKPLVSLKFTFDPETQTTLTTEADQAWTDFLSAALQPVSNTEYETVGANFSGAVAPFALNIQKGDNSYYYCSNQDVAANGREPLTAPTGVAAPTFGASQYGSGGSGGGADGLRAVTMLDWDDAILLSLMVDKTLSGADLQATLDEAVALNGLYNGDLSGITASTYLDSETYSAENPAQALLTAKQGYNFCGWVTIDPLRAADTWTAYTDKDAYDAAFAGSMLSSEFSGDLDSYGSLYLKAGYVENAFCNYLPPESGVDAAMANLYTIVDNSFTYNRYGAASTTTGNYNVSYTVKRQNAEGYGVTRLKKPETRVLLTVTAGSSSFTMYTAATLTADDEQTATVVVPRLAESFTVEVVDSATADIYTQATNYSPAPTVQAVGVKDINPVAVNGDGFIYEGTIPFLNREMKLHITSMMATGTQSAAWNAQVNEQAFIDAKLDDDYTDHCDGIASTSSATNKRNLAKNKLTVYMVSRGMRELTVEEMEAAISLDLGTAANNKAGQLPILVNNAQLTNVLKRVDAMYHNASNSDGNGGYNDLAPNQIKFAVQSTATSEGDLAALWTPAE